MPKSRSVSLVSMLAGFILPVAAQSSQSPKPLAATSIPQYVLDYAPLVWLHSNEDHYRSDIGQQLVHTTPMVDWEPIGAAPSPDTLNNLNVLNGLTDATVFLTSNEGIDADPQPEWFHGVAPDANGKTGDAITSVIITRDHGNGTLDAFYFHFYAFNDGTMVLGMEFGVHVGDWEHNMVRFENGEPTAVWFSQHGGGQAFTYDATEKQGKRPYAYSADGSHAVYAIAGDHGHAIPNVNLPGGIVVDHTDRGTLWDPTMSAYAYSYDASSDEFQPYDDSYPVDWLYFAGRWGDDTLPGGPGVFGQKKYVAGPTGPKFKDLKRADVCPSDPCTVLPFLIWKRV